MQRFSSALRAEGATAAAGWVGGYCEGVFEGRWALYSSHMRSCHGHKQNGLKIDSLRWSTTTKQLSGLCWQNEYWRRPISTGTGPNMKYHSQPGDWTLRLSLLNWFITRSVKKDPNRRNRATCKSTLNRQAIHLSLITTLPNKLRRSMGGNQSSTTRAYSFSVREKRYCE